MKKPYKLFTSMEQFKRVDTARIIYLIIFILALLMTEIGRYVFRPIVIRNELSDYGLTDSIGNWGGIIAQIFFGLALLNSNNKQGYRVIGFCTIGYIVYEFLQPILPKGTFDWKDIIGTILGGLLSCIIYLFIQKLFKGNRVQANDQ